jgi:hypothetical protein
MCDGRSGEAYEPKWSEEKSYVCSLSVLPRLLSDLTSSESCSSLSISVREAIRMLA